MRSLAFETRISRIIVLDEYSSFWYLDRLGLRPRQAAILSPIPLFVGCSDHPEW